MVHLTIDNGCTGNIIRLNVVENLKIDIKPTKVKAKLADDKTFLDVVGDLTLCNKQFGKSHSGSSFLTLLLVSSYDRCLETGPSSTVLRCFVLIKPLRNIKHRFLLFWD